MPYILFKARFKLCDKINIHLYIQQWSPNTFEDNKACLVTIEVSSHPHL
jgi:hypothetical protein